MSVRKLYHAQKWFWDLGIGKAQCENDMRAVLKLSEENKCALKPIPPDCAT